MSALNVVYATPRFVVIDKPSGLLSCPGRTPELQDAVSTRVPTCFPEARGSLLVHRLDQPTSGLMVVALDVDAHQRLSRAFERREVQKEYEAVVAGQPRADSGEIRLSFRVDLNDRPRQMLDPVHGKLGVTRYAVVARLEDRARLRFWPETGRTHQLRVHAAHPLGLGTPILGDALYGDAASAPRLLLHATRLTFPDPTTGEPLTFASACPF